MNAFEHFKPMARYCSLWQEVLGAIAYGIFMAATVGVVWLLAGVWTAVVAFFAALGLAFLYMDVGSLPSDPECEQPGDYTDLRGSTRSNMHNSSSSRASNSVEHGASFSSAATKSR